MRTKIFWFIQTFFSLLPVCKNKIFFLSYYGKQYGCSPKYLSEYIVKKHPEWKVVWAFIEPEKYSIAGIVKVRYLSLKYFYELCTSRVLVTNYRMTEDYRKRRDQYYIMTWHSSLRLKKIEGDTESTLPVNYVRMAKNDSQKIDVLLSGCDFSGDIFRRAFWYDGMILKSGTPRSDIFYAKDKDYRISTIKKKLGIKESLGIILYAPTFRKGDKLDSYNLVFDKLVNDISIDTGKEWIVLGRLHPHLSKYSNTILQGNHVVDVTDYDDIQELLLISDILITDYSSLMFDFAETRRPCFLYTPDLEDYQKNDRSLYFQLEDLPFPVSQTQNELHKQIQNFDKANYAKSINNFMKTVGSYEDGNASKRVTEYIERKWIR